MPTYTGREAPWNLTITISSTDYHFRVAKENDTPIWRVSRESDIAGQGSGVADVPRNINSWHAGFGWSQYQAPNTYHWCDSLDARFPGQLILGPLVTTITLDTTDSTNGAGVLFEIPSLSGYVFAVAGKNLHKIDLSNDTESTSTLATNFVATGAMNFDGYVYIASSGTERYYRYNGTTATQAANDTEDGLKGEYFAQFHADSDLVLAQNFLSGSNPSVAWCARNASPWVAGNWSGSDGSYSVGDTTGTVTALAGFDRQLFIAKTDGLYYLDGEVSEGRLAIPALPTDSNNGKQTMVDSLGRVWYPCQSGLYRYDPSIGEIADVSPGRGLANRSGVRGRVTALAQFRSWTYATVYDGTSSYLMCGRDREEGEPGYGPMIWHGYLAKFSSMNVLTMMISSKTSPPRLWFGLSTGNVAYIKLPGNGDNPADDSNCTFASAGVVYMPADDFGSPGMRWQLSDMVYEAYGLQPDQGTPDQIVSVTPYERRDATPTNYSNNNGWTALASAGTTNGRVVTTLTGDKRFNRAEIRLDVANGVTGGTTTPVIRAIAAKASPRPSKRDVIRTTLILGDAVTSRMGIQSRVDAAALITQLKTLDSLNPVTVKDYWTGVERSQTCLVIDMERRVIQQEGYKSVVEAVDLVMRVEG